MGIGSGEHTTGLQAFEGLFVGHDPLAIARHVRSLETIDFHAGRYWPLEAALWDIAGQVAGLPVATLFGGASDEIPAYASCGMLLPTASRVAATAARPSSRRRGSTRILRARNPSSRSRSADAARSSAGSSIPHDA